MPLLAITVAAVLIAGVLLVLVLRTVRARPDEPPPAPAPIVDASEAVELDVLPEVEPGVQAEPGPEDGVQQRLTVARLRLVRVAQAIERGDRKALSEVDEVGAELELALDELRDQGQGR